MRKPWVAVITARTYQINECECDFYDVSVSNEWYHMGCGDFYQYFETERDAKDGVIEAFEKQIVDAKKNIQELKSQ